MQYKRFGGEDNLSVLGFGCMRLPCLNEDSSCIDLEQAQKMVDKAIDAGVNYFDTAYVYHGQNGEQALAKLLRPYPREQYYLADKFPLSVDRTGARIEEIFECQLQRCETDYFDYYLIHAVQRTNWKSLKNSRIYQTLRDYQNQGKIRHLGMSFHDTPEMLREILDTYSFDFVQIQLNYLDWNLIDSKRCYELLAEREIPVFVMEPLRGGFLADISQPAFRAFYQAAPDRSPASWGLRWVAGLPAVQVVLSGMTHPDQVEDNLRTMEQFAPLNTQEQRVIETVRDTLMKQIEIPCTGCAYCMPCPFQVNIPLCFNHYNRYAVTRTPKDMLLRYKTLQISQQDAAQCRRCGKCLEKCPQHIRIPQMLQRVKETNERLQREERSGKNA